MGDTLHADGPAALRTALRDAIDSPLSRASVIADADHECAFPEISEFLTAIQGRLAECRVRPDDCITLELANSVPSALLALACLDANHSVVLMPIEELGVRAIGTDFPAPRFSRWIVAVRDGLHSGKRQLGAAETYLDVRPNPDYDPSCRQTPDRDRTSGSLGAPKLV